MKKKVLTSVGHISNRSTSSWKVNDSNSVNEGHGQGMDNEEEITRRIAIYLNTD